MLLMVASSRQFSEGAHSWGAAPGLYRGQDHKTFRRVIGRIDEIRQRRGLAAEHREQRPDHPVDVAAVQFVDDERLVEILQQHSLGKPDTASARGLVAADYVLRRPVGRPRDQRVRGVQMPRHQLGQRRFPGPRWPVEHQMPLARFKRSANLLVHLRPDADKLREFRDVEIGLHHFGRRGVRRRHRLLLWLFLKSPPPPGRPQCR